ncbi:MAG: alpha/beta fold hydrolase [Deltaproteobacteria bacterium]|nr:alpha/beta fold hydrolase [Deltaproteobacteria bacterium]
MLSTHRPDRSRRAAQCRALVSLLLALAGCATPVGVDLADPDEVYRTLTANVLTTREPSAASQQLLLRLDLAKRFEDDPERTLMIVHAGLGGPDEQARLFALAELAFSLADRQRDPPWFLASALYACAFLFPDDPARAPEPSDPRYRVALDIYNRGLASGLVGDGHTRELDLSARSLGLPFGTLEMASDDEFFHWGASRLKKFEAVADYRVRGLRNRYRRPGIGAPVAATIADAAQHLDDRITRWVPPDAKVPFTMVLRVNDLRSGLDDGHLVGRLERFDEGETSCVSIGRACVPLEFETSSAIAYRLEASPVWDTEIAGFRSGDLPLVGGSADRGLTMLAPYRPGRIPVVFVHGTASSPARWAEMLNEILGDPGLAGRFQYWLFTYHTGAPIAMSAANLRGSLTRAVQALDPDGKDPALRDMVVIGHSQGGLLTKMQVVSPGNTFWALTSDQPIESLDLSPDTRDELERAVFFEPLPFVHRVVFIATPHRGSFLSRGILGWIASSLVELPKGVTRLGVELTTRNPTLIAQRKLRVASRTAVDQMDPDNTFLQALATLPIASGVTAHSIVAVAGDGRVTDGDDGVVEYKSAHIDGVASELVVRSGHSTQAEPATIEEVRRILHVHVDELDGTATRVAGGFQ